MQSYDFILKVFSSYLHFIVFFRKQTLRPNLSLQKRYKIVGPLTKVLHLRELFRCEYMKKCSSFSYLCILARNRIKRLRKRPIKLLPIIIIVIIIILINIIIICSNTGSVVHDCSQPQNSQSHMRFFPHKQWMIVMLHVLKRRGPYNRENPFKIALPFVSTLRKGSRGLTKVKLSKVWFLFSRLFTNICDVLICHTLAIVWLAIYWLSCCYLLFALHFFVFAKFCAKIKKHNLLNK